MKIQEENIHVERSGTSEENVFTIKATSKAFDILSSGLYSDKIRAIVRELSCNAYDSHVAAGYPEKPIEVQLPTAINLTFYVRDYGVGMTHEQVMSLYTTYFESTKVAVMDQIGQHGLGSKSPFSYASTFMVESIHDGMKRIYTCYKNEQNLPAIALMGEEPTAEHNGVTVSVGVKPADIGKFETAARKVFMYFDTVPDVKGIDDFEPYSISRTVSGTGWMLRDASYYANMHGAYVIQGLVAYPIDASLLEEHGLTGAALKLANADIDVEMAIGSVSTAPSREALSYDRATIANLIGMFQMAATEFHSRVQAQFDECKTPWEAASLYVKLSSDENTHTKLRELFLHMHEVEPFVWNGKNATDYVEVLFEDVLHTKVQVVRVVRERRKNRLSVARSWAPDGAPNTVPLTFSMTPKMVIIKCDHPTALRDEIVNHLLSIGGNCHAIVLRPVSRTFTEPKEFDRIVEALGGPQPIDSDTFPRVSATRTRGVGSGGSRGGREAGEFLVFTQFPQDNRNHYYYRGDATVRRTFSHLTWRAQEFDLADGGLYVPLDRYTPKSEGHANVHYLDVIVKSSKALGLLDADVEIVGFNKRDLKRALAASDDWQNLFEVIEQRFKDLVQSGGVTQALTYFMAHSDSHIPKAVHEVLVSKWDTLKTSVAPGEFYTYVDTLHTAYTSGAASQGSHVQQLRKYMHNLKVGSATLTIEDIINGWKQVCARYPLVPLVISSDASKWVSHAIDYVNLIDG